MSKSVRHGQRRDIEGLRAVAVLLVVADHLFGAPRGGFVGVDVFFVISGFLISGMLVEEFDRTGAISFRNFYARRVRRILPAAVLTLILTCLVAHALFFESRARQTFVDAGWAASSAVNWHFVITGTDYFQSTLPPSAVQQYWSLSVEEQFYLVWPGLIILSGLISRLSRRKNFRKTATVVFCVVILSSLAWALFQSRSDTTVAYFSTLTRGWELGAGALAAMVASRLRHVSARVSAIVTGLGLTMITFAALMTRSDDTFPAPGALPAVVGTLAVILSGCTRHVPYNPLLMNPICGFLGRISYSIYLVHWPIIIFSGALVRSALLRPALVCAATLLIATLSYQLIEQPIRHTTWLSAPSASRTRRGLSLRAKRGYTLALACVAMATLVQGLAVRDVVATQAATVPVAEPSDASGVGHGPRFIG